MESVYRLYPIDQIQRLGYPRSLPWNGVKAGQKDQVLACTTPPTPPSIPPTQLEPINKRKCGYFKYVEAHSRQSTYEIQFAAAERLSAHTEQNEGDRLGIYCFNATSMRVGLSVGRLEAVRTE